MTTMSCPKWDSGEIDSGEFPWLTGTIPQQSTFMNMLWQYKTQSEIILVLLNIHQNYSDAQLLTISQHSVLRMMTWNNGVTT